ncbi:MAG TPA: sigma-70 family RNA polymerase sigma factor [Gemmatimonas sp.]|nr:sigma-70 family RNA polymerase sigma factor [Gemmatimonas sp.]
MRPSTGNARAGIRDGATGRAGRDAPVSSGVPRATSERVVQLVPVVSELPPASLPSASPEVLEERGLVLAAQQGDGLAFAGLVRRHQRRAYAVARAIVLSHDDAEDAVQEAFLHAFRALERFRPEQAFGAWLHRIVANAALDIARRKKVRDADELPETLSSPHRDPAEADELRMRLSQALETLNERQRAVIVLHDVEGYKHAEIGTLLGIPEGTARSDLHHARAHLRRQLGNLRSDS